MVIANWHNSSPSHAAAVTTLIYVAAQVYASLILRRTWCGLHPSVFEEDILFLKALDDVRAKYCADTCDAS